MTPEHISYAMRNEEARQSLVWINNPVELLHWSMPLLEILMIGGAIIAFVHALRSLAQKNEPAYLYTWLATIFYGLVVEILSYNFVDNFWHGEFTVMLYYNHLPLYIVALYPAVVYPTFLLVRGLGLTDKPLGRLREACCAAFAAQMFYIPFDNLGPLLQWWVWDVDSVSLQPFWYSVPSTSYLWMMTFSMAFAVTARWLLWERAVDKGYGWGGWLLSAVAVGIVTNIVSVSLQSPLTLLTQVFSLYFIAGAITTVLMALNTWVYWFRPRCNEGVLDPLLIVFPAAWVSFFVALYSYYTAVIFRSYAEGLSPMGTPAGNYALAMFALVMVVIVYLAPCWGAARQRGVSHA